MLTDRANAICLLEILREYSDSEHILPMREITSKMELIYGIKPDRRTVYSAIQLLAAIGYDISTYEENGIGYYLRNRDFEPSEVMLLTDAVYSFPFIPAGQSEELIEKLQRLVPAPRRRKYGNLRLLRQNDKTDNRQVFWNIDILDDAISQKKQVSFTYLQYGLDKQLHPRREKPYVVNPYGMVYTNEHYYLICNLAGYPNMSLYRIDYIKDIAVLDTACEVRNKNMGDAESAVFAFIGKPERIEMRCDMGILSDVIDKFGTDVHITPVDEKTFSASFIASPRGVKFWALQYLPYCEIIKPEKLREEVIKSIRGNKYTKTKERIK